LTKKRLSTTRNPEPVARSGREVLARVYADRLDAVGLTRDLMGRAVTTLRRGLSARRQVAPGVTSPDWGNRIRAAGKLLEVGLPAKPREPATAISVHFPGWLETLIRQRRDEQARPLRAASSLKVAETVTQVQAAEDDSNVTE
jgi:hypothetical protein